MNILNFLKLPETKNITDLDHPSATLLHAQIIQRKSFLKKIYTDFYNQFKKSVTSLPAPRVLIELGSGGGFIKEVVPDAVTTEIMLLPNVDIQCSALHLPFRTNSVDGFFLLDVLHHVPDPGLFFEEILRCLKPDGKTVMIEPANTLWSRWVYRNFHHEPFDPQAGWSLAQAGPLSQANIALPWIIFYRDRKVFENRFPRLEITRIKIHTPFRYLVSGGLSFKQLMPSFTYPIFQGLEKILSPLNKHLGMFMSIELRKR